MASSAATNPPISVPPPQKFIDVKQLIDQVRCKRKSSPAFYSHRDFLAEQRIAKAVHTLIFTHFLDSTERMAFLNWFSKMAYLESLAEEERAAKEPMLDNGQYRDALLSVDWSSTDSIDEFDYQLRGIRVDRWAEPICLGRDHAFLFYLDPQSAPDMSQTDLESGVHEHPFVIEMRAVNKANPPFKFGFELGRLSYLHMKDARKSPLRLFETPFIIYLDVVSGWLWMVFNTYFWDNSDLEESVQLEPESNAWEYLPSPQNDRPSFKAMRIMNMKDLGMHDQRYSFFNRRTLPSAFDTLLVPWSAKESQVQTAIASRTNTPTTKPRDATIRKPAMRSGNIQLP